MRLLHIEHCLVLADDMDKTRDWYRDVLGRRSVRIRISAFRCIGFT